MALRTVPTPLPVTDRVPDRATGTVAVASRSVGPTARGGGGTARARLRRFVDANVATSGAIERRLGLESDKPFWARFDRLVRDAVGSVPDGGTIVDLGGGRRCSYASAVPRERGVRIVAVDISAEELAHNEQVDEARLADVADELPFPRASVDLVVSRALLEHVDGVPSAVRNMAEVLRPGGQALHFVPARYSLFGTAARLLPFRTLLQLLHAVSPETRGHVEFEVHYDHCSASALEREFRRAGFRSVEVQTCWSQSGYFFPCTPLYVVVALYQAIVRRLGVRGLAAYLIVTARR